MVEGIMARTANDEEYELRLPVTSRDVRAALRLIEVHRPQRWPNGTLCVNDRSQYPCTLLRWAWRVLDWSKPTSGKVG
jgi:hypothetical protein